LGVGDQVGNKFSVGGRKIVFSVPCAIAPICEQEAANIDTIIKVRAVSFLIGNCQGVIIPHLVKVANSEYGLRF